MIITVRNDSTTKLIELTRVNEPALRRVASIGKMGLKKYTKGACGSNASEVYVYTYASAEHEGKGAIDA